MQILKVMYSYLSKLCYCEHVLLTYACLHDEILTVVSSKLYCSTHIIIGASKFYRQGRSWHAWKQLNF